MTSSTPLPLVLTGPVLRRLEPQRLAIWLVATQPLQPEFIFPASEAKVDCQVVPVGQHAFIHLLEIHFANPLPCNQQLDYDLLINGQGIAGWAPHLLYPGTQRPSLVLRDRLDHLLHGSCRKPHHPLPMACCALTACCRPASSLKIARPCC